MDAWEAKTKRRSLCPSPRDGWQRKLSAGRIGSHTRCCVRLEGEGGGSICLLFSQRLSCQFLGCCTDCILRLLLFTCVWFRWHCQADEADKVGETDGPGRRGCGAWPVQKMVHSDSGEQFLGHIRSHCGAPRRAAALCAAWKGSRGEQRLPGFPVWGCSVLLSEQCLSVCCAPAVPSLALSQPDSGGNRFSSTLGRTRQDKTRM